MKDLILFQENWDCPVCQSHQAVVCTPSSLGEVGKQCREGGEMCGRSNSTKLLWMICKLSYCMSIRCWLTLLSDKSVTDDFQFLGSTDNLVCGHSWQACLSSQRCPRPCSSAQLCHSFCDRCSHNRIISTLAHMYTSKSIIADLQ